MSSCRQGIVRLAATLVLAAPAVCPAEFVLGLGAEADTADSRAFAALGDVSVADDTWLGGSVVTSSTDGLLADLRTTAAHASLDHFFGAVGFRIGAGHWGKEDFLESADWRAAIYLRGKAGYLAFEYERREFDLTIDAEILDVPRTVEFSANGLGLTARLQAGDGVSLLAGGMTYDYSRDISLEPRIDILRFFTLSRLSLMSTLLDYRVSAGVDFAIGERRIDVQAARWRTAVDQGRIDSIGAGLLTPFGSRADLELRLSYDDSENFGRATVFSVFLYYYGG